jgi:hypothetical protein
MGFELLQPFLEFAFAFLGLALVLAAATGLTLAISYIPWWTYDKAEDFADRLEASWNVKAA